MQLSSQPHACHACAHHCLSRRSFVAASALALSPVRAFSQSKERQSPIDLPLRVLPILVYEVPKKREGTSYRQWGGIETEAQAAAEKERIGRELAALAGANRKLEMLPLVTVQTVEQAAVAAGAKRDVTLLYAAGGNNRVLDAAFVGSRWNLMFLRHQSGPVYLWYEIAHPRFLRKTVDEFDTSALGVKDVIVDDQAEIGWKLRALYGLKNSLGKKVVAVGGPSGWGKGGQEAPRHAREDWQLDLRTVDYPELGERIQRARADAARVRRCNADAERYMSQKGVTVETSREFVQKAFLLTDVFRDLLDEAQTDAITINQCMGTIMKYSETTACLPLSILNDEGYMAFCESDFVVIPSGILLRYIAGRPVFLNDPTHPHHGMVTIAHCTAPRKLDGKTPEPARILTHFESDYGAAPKVEMRKGMKVTNLIPDFANRKWAGFEGEVIANPFMAICRSQTDISINGSTDKLLDLMKGFHWMTSYGSFLRETGYALGKLGIDLQTIV